MGSVTQKPRLDLRIHPITSRWASSNTPQPSGPLACHRAYKHGALTIQRAFAHVNEFRRDVVAGAEAAEKDEAATLQTSRVEEEPVSQRIQQVLS